MIPNPLPLHLLCFQHKQDCYCWRGRNKCPIDVNGQVLHPLMPLLWHLLPHPNEPNQTPYHRGQGSYPMSQHKPSNRF